VNALLPLLWLLLAPAPDPAKSTTGAEELGFGIEVARKGLWGEARFRFEKALALNPDSAEALKKKPGNLYIQQNYDLFREADDKRNRKSKKR
jgi:hypothetical protein